MTAPFSDPDTHLPKRPVVRLKPKANARAVRHGFPWVYVDEVVTDRRTKALTPGAVAVLQDAAQKPLGLVTVNPNSKIFCRMLDRDVEAEIDEAWFAQRLSKALKARTRLFDAPFYRLVHAEADGLPGVVIDRFDDHYVLQPNAAWAETLLTPLVAALVSVTGAKVVLKNASGRTRTLEGLDEQSAVLLGDAPTAALPVPMNGATYMADLTGGQKTGLFFDQRPNQAFAAGLARDARDMDVISQVGGFALA